MAAILKFKMAAIRLGRYFGTPSKFVLHILKMISAKFGAFVTK